MKLIYLPLLHRHAFSPQGFRPAICTLAAVLFALVAGAKTTSSTNNGVWFQSGLPNASHTWDNGIPAPGDTVNITNAVTLSTNAGVVVNIDSLNVQPSGFLTFSGPVLAVNGAGSVWSAGAFYSGPLVLSGSVTISSIITNRIELGTLTNLGTITHLGTANVGMGANTLVVNAVGGTYDIQSDVWITNISCPCLSFENDGLLRKSGGSGTSFVSTGVNNRGGTIQVQTGRLTVGGGTSSNGTFIVSAGAVLELMFGNFSGVFTGSGAGQVQLNTGGINANLSCSFNFPTNLFQWNGSGIGQSIGGSTLNNLGSLTLASANTKTLGVKLVNTGQVVMTGTGGLINGDLFQNTSGGLFEFQSDSSISNSFSSGSFENDGLVRKSGGSGTSFVAETFNNLGGTIQVLTGRLKLTSGLTGGSAFTNGTFNVSAGAVLDLIGDIDQFNTLYSGVFTGSGAGQVQFNAVNSRINIYPPCTFNFATNLFQWNAGSFYRSTPGSLTNLGTITIANNNQFNADYLDGIALVNLGQVVQTGTNQLLLGGNSPGSFFNASGGLYEFLSNGGIDPNGGGPFTNNGLVRKTGGSGTSTVNASFKNTGTVEARSGTLLFFDFTQTAGTTSLNGGALASTFGLTFLGGSLIGSGQITNNVTSGGIVSPGFSVGTIQINGNYSQTAGGALNIELAGRNPGQFDQLKVTGSATLNGALNISPLAGFVPIAGDAYQILSYSSHSGSFSATNGLSFGLSVDYRASGVFLVVTTNPPVILQPAIVGTNFTFSFNSITGITYTAQSNTNLNTTNWISFQVIPGNGSLKTVIQPIAGAAQQFFRVLRP